MTTIINTALFTVEEIKSLPVEELAALQEQRAAAPVGTGKTVVNKLTSPTVKKWAKRTAAVAVVGGAAYAAHRFGLLDFLKSKIAGETTDVSVV